MSQTLINGTAYEIEKGNTMVNSTQYTIDHGNTLVGGTGYVIEFGSSVPYTIDDWPGWDNATWEDINNLCYAKQQGYIDSWPSDVVLGATKDADITYKVGSSTYNTYTVSWRVVDLDKDAAGTITFDTYRVFNIYDTPSEYKTTMADIYNRTPINPYLVQITKIYGSTATEEENLYIWEPSIEELGISSPSYANKGYYTKGISSAYSYYTNSSTRTKGSAWYARTHANSSIYFLVKVARGGYIDGYSDAWVTVQAARTLMFVIGNPNAQTIE